MEIENTKAMGTKIIKRSEK